METENVYCPVCKARANREKLLFKKAPGASGTIFINCRGCKEVIKIELSKREIRTYIKDKDLLVILDRIIDHNGIFPDGVGIPVGNLTSQLFANVYLHRLDMFVKHTLHAEHYMRYMDDFVIISEDLEQLKRWEKQIEIFLADVLKLQLNPKTTIVYAKNGVDFVGYRHWNSTKKIRKDAMRRLKRLMKNFKDGTITEEFFNKSFTSRIGSIKHADTYNLVQKITCEAKELKESHA